MARKSLITLSHNNSIQEIFELYLLTKRAEGLSPDTLRTYEAHFRILSRYFDADKDITELTRDDLRDMIVALQNENIRNTTISSYVRSFRVFLSWCNAEEYTPIQMKQYRSEETEKEVYTDAQLRRLLKKPNLKNCTYTEYRNWVIVNFLLNCGCRSATVRNIKIADIDIENSLCSFRHNKNRKVQIVPLCSEMKKILREYLYIRGGSDDDYLFVNSDTSQMTKNSLYLAIKRYNLRRGVSLTSIHAFRHTFARSYLLNGGSPFMLQRILNHSTLDMTKHYCRIYNTDMLNGFDELSPLTKLTGKDHIHMRDRPKR